MAASDVIHFQFLPQLRVAGSLNYVEELGEDQDRSA
jgi:hypothetical protein